jgi:RNA polymerase sigma factor (TIGR02999 family)
MAELSKTAMGETGTDALFTGVYDRLKAMASRQRVRGGTPGTLGTTELVHELYLRMGGEQGKRFAEPAQFFAYAAQAMRHLMIDAARCRMQLKAGGDQLRVSMTDPVVGAVEIDPARAVELDTALRALESVDARAARVVELHFFAGLELERVADVLGVARRTVARDWRYARAFLDAHAGS